EARFALVHGASHRSRAQRIRRRGQRDVPLAGEQPRCGIEPDPSSARQVDFGPRVEVGEVHGWAAWSVERLHVGGELYEVSGYEASGQTEVTQGLGEQPSGVAARTAAERHSLCRRLNARLETYDVRDVLRETPVEVHNEVDRTNGIAVDAAEEVEESRARGNHFEERRELLRQPRLVAERKRLGRRLEEE